MVIAVIKLGRIKKLQFSCLYTLISALAGYGAAWTGVYLAGDAITQCLASANGIQERFVAIFACGIVGIFSSMLLWAAVLVIGGFAMMRLSKTNEPMWFERPIEESPEGQLIDQTGSEEE